MEVVEGKNSLTKGPNFYVVFEGNEAVPISIDGKQNFSLLTVTDLIKNFSNDQNFLKSIGLPATPGEISLQLPRKMRDYSYAIFCDYDGETLKGDLNLYELAENGIGLEHDKALLVTWIRKTGQGTDSDKLEGSMTVIYEQDRVIIRGSLHDKPNKRLAKYQAVADEFKDHELVKKIVDRLLKLSTVDLFKNGRFILLQGSAGKGKTQMAFNIQAAFESEKGDRKRSVFYQLFSPAKVDSHEIYQNFKSRSALFAECLKRDDKHYTTWSEYYRQIIVTESLEVGQYFIFGYICEMIAHSESTEVATVAAKSKQDVMELMVSMGYEKHTPIFIIDEYPAMESEIDATLSIFLRKAFFEVGIALVIISTDVKIAVVQEQDMYHAVQPVPRCYIFADYPPVELDLLNITIKAKKKELLMEIIKKSRPWFSQLACDYARTNGKFSYEDMADYIFERVIKYQDLFNTYAGKYGQVELLRCAQYPTHARHYYTFLLNHFAEMDDSKELVISTRSSVMGTFDYWYPMIRFPKIEEDLLLYLAFLGGKKYKALLMEEEPVPFLHFYSQGLSSPEAKPDPEYQAQSVPSMEITMISCMCLASHSNGFGGVDLQSFLLDVYYHLQLTKVDQEFKRFKKFKWLEPLKLKVPFLSPPNQVWPEFLIKASEFNLGNLYMLKKQDHTFLGITGYESITAESIEDDTFRINSDKMVRIIERIPAKSKLHMVFVRRLQQTYFKSGEYRDYNAFGDRVYLKLDAKSERPVLERVCGLPFKIIDPSGGVLFIEAPKP